MKILHLLFYKNINLFYFYLSSKLISYVNIDVVLIEVKVEAIVEVCVVTLDVVVVRLVVVVDDVVVLLVVVVDVVVVIQVDDDVITVNVKQYVAD
mgnify:CR=1 FL=1